MFLKNSPRTLRKNKNFTGRGNQKSEKIFEKIMEKDIIE
jgi:hypothetical protein